MDAVSRTIATNAALLARLYLLLTAACAYAFFQHRRLQIGKGEKQEEGGAVSRPLPFNGSAPPKDLRSRPARIRQGRLVSCTANKEGANKAYYNDRLQDEHRPLIGHGNHYLVLCVQTGQRERALL